MATAVTIADRDAESVADLLDRLGGISARRVRLHPPPGTATEADLVSILDHEGSLYELVDDTLVEKISSFMKAVLTAEIGHLLIESALVDDLGVVAGQGGPVRLAPGLVRLPDVSFYSWDKFPSRRVPLDPVASAGPDLAVEVISPGNTRKEMKRKRREYFAAGVQLVWQVYPRTGMVEVYAPPPAKVRRLAEKQVLDGGSVLPRFKVSLTRLFSRISPRKR